LCGPLPTIKLLPPFPKNNIAANMAKMLIITTLLAVSTSALAMSGGFLRNVEIHSQPDYKWQCGLESGLRILPGAAAFLQDEVEEAEMDTEYLETAPFNQVAPGAGMTKSAIVPFTTVLKDGFMKTDCLVDEMYSHGDKHGRNKHSYNQAKVSGVSIIHYDDFIDKLDRKPMSHDVCFEFCRTVPQMGAFGITNGRHCYCAPYYRAIALDDTPCDAPCDGNPSQMCGGKKKSTVFVMHQCNDAKANVDALLTKAATQKGSFDAKYAKIGGLNASILSEVAFFAPLFAQVADVTAATQFQTATAEAVELQRALSAADRAAATELTTKVGLATTLSAEGMAAFTNPVKLKQAEALQIDIKKLMVILAAEEVKFDKLIALAENAVDKNGSAAVYRSAMYFADKKYETAPSVCGGKALGKPIMAKNEDSCASACDASMHASRPCTAFQYFKHAAQVQANATDAAMFMEPQQDMFLEPRQGSSIGPPMFLELFGGGSGSVVQEPGLCFLFSKLNTITYYTGKTCNSPLKPIPSSIPMGATCFAKFSKSVGKIDKPSDRCFKDADANLNELLTEDKNSQHLTQETQNSLRTIISDLREAKAEKKEEKKNEVNHEAKAEKKEEKKEEKKAEKKDVQQEAKTEKREEKKETTKDVKKEAKAEKKEEKKEVKRDAKAEKKEEKKETKQEVKKEAKADKKEENKEEKKGEKKEVQQEAKTEKREEKKETTQEVKEEAKAEKKEKKKEVKKEA